ncbi:glycoside hydrolase [Arcobacter sp. CECT 8989]|uniref:glycoside hydrolase family protein n=1 Tax=Arcobacter sp. CECT 8989 TaxID=2044509 RepID=UPI00100B7B5C|nr:glycoside hydrolase family protein [Arcobacter sp. CECT 8989]RXK01507.1 glycoside hydrolase [Arcobacter sp. CECT 8989]
MKYELLIESVKKHEGLRLKPYRCPVGKLTIGYGRNLEDTGITEEEANFLLVRDLQRVQNALRKKINYDEYPSHVQNVLLEMGFQLGVNGLMKFKKTLQLIEEGNYIGASKEMLNSKWAKQTPKRANTLSKLMREGF